MPKGKRDLRERDCEDCDLPESTLETGSPDVGAAALAGEDAADLAVAGTWEGGALADAPARPLPGATVEAVLLTADAGG